MNPTNSNPNPTLPSSIPLQLGPQQQTPQLLFFAPKNLSTSALAIAPLLFSQFQFPEGKIGLDGCRLELRPVIQIPASSASHQFRDHQGTLLRSFSLPTQDTSEPITSICRELSSWIPWLENQLFQVLADSIRGQHQENENNTIKVYWCYFLQGKMRFHLEERNEVKNGHRAESDPLPRGKGNREESSVFSGWLHQLEENPVRIQPFICPLTGSAGYQLTVDDEGTIALQQSVHRCSVTGARLIESKLIQCHQSKKWVKHDQALWCDECHQPLAPDSAQLCVVCGQATCRPHSGKKSCLCCQRIFDPNQKKNPSDAAAWEKENNIIAEQFPEFANNPYWVSSGQKVTRIGLRSVFHEYLFVFNQQSSLISRFSRLRLIGNWQPMKEAAENT